MEKQSNQQWLAECRDSYKRTFEPINWMWHETGPNKQLSVLGFVEAGLHFYAEGKSPDSVYCPYCKVELYGWGEGDFPLEEHKLAEGKTGESCMFLDVLIGRYTVTKFDRFANHYVQNESYDPAIYDAQPGTGNDGEADEKISITSHEERENIKQQAKLIINVQERKKELARKMIGLCPICDGKEKIVVKSCRHVNCANYIDCCGGFCMVCGEEITEDGLVTLKIRVPSRQITAA